MEIIKVYQEVLQECRFIGLKYTNKDRDEVGSFSIKWHEWFQRGLFKPLEKLTVNVKDYDSFIGLMRCHHEFEYWIGVFCPKDTHIPNGYQALDFDEIKLGTCWIYGKQETGEIYGDNAHQACVKSLLDNKMKIKEHPWCIERYVCPRFTVEDEFGKVILDYCIEIL